MHDMHRKYRYCSCPECAEKRALVEHLAQIAATENGDDPLHIFDDMGDASQSSVEMGKIIQPNRKHTGDRRNGGK